MHRLRDLAACTALGLSAASCGGLYASGEMVREHMQQDAPVNLVYVPVTEAASAAATAPTGELATGMAYPDAADQPQLTEQLQRSFSAASGGRFVPETFTYTQAPALSIGRTCLGPGDHRSLEAIKTHAEAHSPEEGLRVAIAQIEGCVPGHVGFASVDTGDVPVLTSRGRLLARNALHELAHTAGLGHANTADCEDPVSISGCHINEAEDETSLMSHNGGQAFTAPELHALGLLDEREYLVNPEAGIYLLAPGHTEASAVLKTMMFASHRGKIYVSWERDRRAQHDIACLPAEEYALGAAANSYTYHLQVDSADQTTAYTCVPINFRDTEYSLQVRFQEQGYMNLVTRADRVAGNPVEIRYNGEVVPGAVAYQHGSTRLSFVGIDANGNAIVQVD